ncbi:ATP/GTP-binding protein [Streptomyces wedmorensis]
MLFGSNDQELSADEAFTNHQGQWAHVIAALTEHLQQVSAPGFDVEDLEAPRRNVLHFHGVGGIGKSTLSRKIETVLAGSGRPAHWPEAARPGVRVVPVRIDLARSAGMDFEQIVLTLRLALTRIGRPLPAFDIALRRYWETVHPGEPLKEYLNRGGLARAFGQALPQQMKSALADVAQALLLPGTVVGDVVGSLVSALRERRQTVRALSGCRRLADLLEAEPDLEALSYHPHLLAWEIARLPGERVVPVVLFDTFEDTGDRTRREMERLLQRVVWLMPNALFVITGRSRLEWAEDALAGRLDYTGPAAWPDLADPATWVPAPITTDPEGPERSEGVGAATPADVVVDMLSTLARRQREHRGHTVDKLTRLIDPGLLGDDLTVMAVYYRAKAWRDIGHPDASRRDYQHVADHGGRLAAAARRGLAKAAHLAGDFPTAHTAAQQLGWEGRHQRVLGGLYGLQGEPERAAAAYLAGRTEAEEHAVRGEAAHNQAKRALAIAFTDPHLADDELDLAYHLLTGLELRATTINTEIAALVRDAGHDTVDDRVRTLRAELDIAGLISKLPTLEIAAAFHQAVLDDDQVLGDTLGRLREQTRGGMHAYAVDIVHFMAGLPLPDDHVPPRRLDDEQTTRSRWRRLVIRRQTLLRTRRSTSG